MELVPKASQGVGTVEDLADMDVVFHREREVKGETRDGAAVEAEPEAYGTVAGDMVGMS